MAKEKIKIIFRDLATELHDLLSDTKNNLTIVSPWIKLDGSKLIVDSISDKTIKVNLYTRINIVDFAKGISDLTAINLLTKNFDNLSIKGIPNLHAKIYISDRSSAIISSGNLTSGGLNSNIEGGVLLRDANFIGPLSEQIANLFEDATDISKDLLDLINKDIKVFGAQIKANQRNESREIEDKVILSYGKRIDYSSSKNVEYLTKIRKDIRLDVLEVDIDKKVIWEKGKYGQEVIDKIATKYPYMRKIEPSMLESGLLHPSYTNSKLKDRVYLSSFRRLNILGKAILNCMVYSHFYLKYGNRYSSEIIVKMHDEFIATFCLKHSLFSDQYLFKYLLKELGNDPVDSVKTQFSNVIVAILYLSMGFADTEKIIFSESGIDSVSEMKDLLLNIDPKSALMEISQSIGRGTPTYKDIEESGPDNAKIFKGAVVINGKVVATGVGPTKKDSYKFACLSILKEPKNEKVVMTWITKKISSIAKIKRDIPFPNSNREVLLRELSRLLNISTKNLPLLNCALTHSSWCNDHKQDKSFSNTDMVMVGSYIFDSYVYTKVFLNFSVSEKNFMDVSKKVIALKNKIVELLDLSKYKLIGDTTMDSVAMDNILNQMFLSLLWVKFIDSGYSEAFNMLDKLFEDKLDIFFKRDELITKDPTSRLQELIQSDGKDNRLLFSVLDYSGPVHQRKYRVGVYYQSNLLGIGRGDSTKLARSDASRNALIKIGKY